MSNAGKSQDDSQNPIRDEHTLRQRRKVATWFPDSSRKAGVGDWTFWMWTFRKVAPLLALLVLASCADETSRGVTSIRSHTFGRARGIDMATDARDNLNELKHSRLDFIARYYRDPASRWPTLSAREAHQLSSLGLSIVAVWEWHSHKPEYFSYASGYRDAVAAQPGHRDRSACP